MKKITLYLMAICLSFTFNPSNLNAANVVKAPVEKSSVSSDALINRLKDINKLAKTNLSSSEKKTLRSEVQSINAKLHADGGGVYISVTAIILILILLIILL